MRFPIFLLSIFSLLQPLRSQAESFTNNAGRTIQGEINEVDFDAGIVKIFVQAHRKEFPVKLADLDQSSRAKIEAWWKAKNPSPADWVKPGAQHSIEFPDLPKQNHDGGVATMNISIPEHYDPKKPIPLLVWLQGGKGGNNTGPAKAMSKDHFVSVALPYPPYAGRDPLTRCSDGSFDEFWNYQKVMLDRLEQEVTNIDPRLRVISGFSHGGNTIGGYMHFMEKETSAYYNAYVFGDGGNIRWESFDRRLFANKHAYVTWGEKEESSNKKWSLKVLELCEKAKMQVVSTEMKGTGHTFTNEEKDKVHTWLLDVVYPDVTDGGSLRQP